MKKHLAVYGLILLSFFLRVYQLNNVVVEKAEMTNIVWFIRHGWLAILTENKALNNHPLNAVLGYLTSSLGYESLFTLRWHSVVIGVITVAVLWRLAREWFGRRAALTAGLLLSVSAYHINLSQRARGYVGLVGFTLLGFYFARRALQTGQKRYWVGFIIASVLNIYSHLYGAMAVGVIGLLALALAVKPGALKKITWRPFIPVIISLAVIYLISLGLYWPMAADTLGMVGSTNQFRESDVRHTEQSTPLAELAGTVVGAISSFNLAGDSDRLRLDDPTFHYSPFDSLGVLAETWPGFYLTVTSFLLGLIFSWRKFRLATLICLAWLVITFLAQWAVYFLLPGAYFRGRFLSFIYITYFLLMARGWPGLADWLKARWSGRPVLQTAAAIVGWLGVGALVALNVAWLGVYYSAAGNEHWQDIANQVKPLLQPGDFVYCGQRANTSCSFDLSVRLHREVKEVDDTFITFEELDAKRAQFEQPGRVWVILPHTLAWQDALLQQRLSPTHYSLLGNPAYDRSGWALIDSQPTLVENLDGALRLMVDLSLNNDEKYKNYFNLAKIDLAREQLAAAEAAFAIASEPWPGADPIWQQQQLAPVAERLAYARQTNQATAALPATSTRADLNFGGLARLAAYEIAPQTVSPGQAVRVNLYWLPLQPIKRNLVSYVYLTDVNGHLLNQVRGIPGAGQSPTTSWQPGQVVLDTYTIAVDSAAPAPLATQLEVGLFDPANSEFIKAIDRKGQPVGAVLARVKVMPPQPAAAPPTHPLTADFGGLITLVGYDLAVNPPGIVFYWQAKTEIKQDYVVFVHLLKDNNQLAAQMDGPPLAGNYPTSWWSPGEVVVDHHLGGNIAPGRYRLLAGWYQLADGARLPLADGSGDSLPLGVIDIP